MTTIFAALGLIALAIVGLAIAALVASSVAFVCAFVVQVLGVLLIGIAAIVGGVYWENPVIAAIGLILTPLGAIWAWVQGKELVSLYRK